MQKLKTGIVISALENHYYNSARLTMKQVLNSSDI